MRLPPPPPRFAALALVVLVTATVGATSARADSAGDAAATTVSAFLDALAREDAARACSLFTDAALDRLGGVGQCTSSFSDDSGLDEDAAQTLARTYQAARKSAAKHKGHYVTKAFGLRALARDIERRDPELTIMLGRGPSAAAGQLATTAILDVRSTARRLVVYAESDDGSIWRLSASERGAPDLDEVAAGVPETPAGPPHPAFTFTVDALTPFGNGDILARATLTVVERGSGKTETYSILLVVIQQGAEYRIDNVFYSILDEP